MMEMNMKLRCDRIWRAWTLFSISSSLPDLRDTEKSLEHMYARLLSSLPVLHASFRVKIVSKRTFEAPFIGEFGRIKHA